MGKVGKGKIQAERSLWEEWRGGNAFYGVAGYIERSVGGTDSSIFPIANFALRFPFDSHSPRLPQRSVPLVLVSFSFHPLSIHPQTLLHPLDAPTTKPVARRCRQNKNWQKKNSRKKMHTSSQRQIFMKYILRNYFCHVATRKLEIPQRQKEQFFWLAYL